MIARLRSSLRARAPLVVRLVWRDRLAARTGARWRARGRAFRLLFLRALVSCEPRFQSPSSFSRPRASNAPVTVGRPQRRALELGNHASAFRTLAVEVDQRWSESPHSLASSLREPFINASVAGALAAAWLTAFRVRGLVGCRLRVASAGRAASPPLALPRDFGSAATLGMIERSRAACAITRAA